MFHNANTRRSRKGIAIPENGGRLIGYARISTGDQNLRMQVEALKAAGVLPRDIFTDQATGRTLNRPGLQDALLGARKGDTFVVWKVDRLSRDALDTLYLAKSFKDEGIHFRSLTESMDTTTPIGWFAMGMLALVAEMESNQTGFRTKRGMDSASRLGRRFGPEPTFGKQHYAEAIKMLEQKKMSANAVGKHFGVTGQTVRDKLMAVYGKKFWKPRKQKRKVNR